MKLLDRSIRRYLGYSILVLLIAIPVFYFVIQAFVAEEVEEGLYAQRDQMVSKLRKTIAPGAELTQNITSQFNLTRLHEYHPRDTIYNIRALDKISGEMIPIRVLETNVMIGEFPYRFQIESSLLDSQELIENILIVIAILLILMVAGLLLINQRISKSLWRPFYDTLAKLKAYRLEKIQPLQFENTRIAEFSLLNNAISSLTQRNLQIYQTQKEFTENASHEMQTPLAIVQGKLDLIMQTQPISSQQAELLGDMGDALQRLNRYNQSLLLLTKIENDLFLDKEKMTVEEVVENLLEQYRYQVESRQIRIESAYDKDTSLIANKTLIEILFSNLLSNAIRHNKEGGEIRIQQKGDQFSIQNAGGAPLDPALIFQRFQRDSSNQQSVGLGLAIAQKISDLYHYELAYTFTGAAHQFSLRL